MKKGKMKKKLLIIGGILVVIAVGAYFLLRSKETKSIEWRTAKVEKGDLEIIVTATGTLSADTTVQVGTQVSGVISKIFVDFNSVVKKGQKIAIIDTTFLAAAVVDAEASLYKSSVQVDLTKRTFDRTKELFDEKVMAQADYDQAYSDYQTAVANARSAKASLDRAKINLKYATIIAPVSGVVVSRAVDVGQTVAASFNTPTLFSIANDLTKMQVQANVDEADIGKILNGQEVTFTVDAYEDRSFTGKVSQIRLQPTVTQNVVNYTVIINVPNPDKKLLPGMTANITVHVQGAKDILKLPSSALRFNPSQEVIDKMMKLWPDSIKQKMAKWIGHKGQTGQTTQSGQPDKRTGGQSGQSGQADRQASGQADRRTSGQSGQGGQAGRQTSGQTGQGTQQGVKEKRTSGFIWMKQGEVLIPQRVRLGLSDGSYTEVSGNINEGDDVVIGVINLQGSASSAATQQTSPFQMRPPTGRGGR